jgi:hypothetical protein
MHFQYCQKGRADQAEVFGPVDNTELPLPAALKPEALALRLFKIIAWSGFNVNAGEYNSNASWKRFASRKMFAQLYKAPLCLGSMESVYW